MEKNTQKPGRSLVTRTRKPGRSLNCWTTAFDYKYSRQFEGQGKSNPKKRKLGSIGHELLILAEPYILSAFGELVADLFEMF